VARLTGQYVERAPDAAELFSKGAHDATGTFEIGNSDLEKERARTAELGFKRETGDFRFDASLYYTSFGGFIFKDLTGRTCDATFDSCEGQNPGGGGDLNQLIFGQKDATFYGAELLTEYDVARIWNGIWGIEGQYDFVHAKFDDGGFVPRIPPHRLGGGLYYRDAAWIARASLLHAFRQNEAAPNETPTSGYTLLNAELSYTMRGAAEGSIVPVTTIGIRGENLLDDDVRNSASFKKDEVLLPGASVRVFADVKLN
jgi:iron complex outermembrane receptor protein